MTMRELIESKVKLITSIKDWEVSKTSLYMVELIIVTSKDLMVE